MTRIVKTLGKAKLPLDLLLINTIGAWMDKGAINFIYHEIPPDGIGLIFYIEWSFGESRKYIAFQAEKPEHIIQTRKVFNKVITLFNIKKLV